MHSILPIWCIIICVTPRLSSYIYMHINSTDWYALLQTGSLVGPTGPALGVALLLGDETGKGVEVVMRAGSLRHFSLEGSGTSLVQLRAVFHDTSEAHRLRILRDMRFLLAVPHLEDDCFSSGQQWHQQEFDALCENPQLRVFKPLKFSHEGRQAWGFCLLNIWLNTKW